jgi:hypothetical protein
LSGLFFSKGRDIPDLLTGISTGQMNVSYSFFADDGKFGSALARLWRLETFLRGVKGIKLTLAPENGISSLIRLREELAERACGAIAVQYEYANIVNLLLPVGMTIEQLSSSQKCSLVMFASQIGKDVHVSMRVFAKPFLASCAITMLEGDCEVGNEYIVDKMKEKISTKFLELGELKIYLRHLALLKGRSLSMSTLHIILKELCHLDADFTLLRYKFSSNRQDDQASEELSDCFVKIRTKFVSEIWEYVREILLDMGILQGLAENGITTFLDYQENALAIFAFGICDQRDDKTKQKKRIRNKFMLRSAVIDLWEGPDLSSNIIFHQIINKLPEGLESHE